MPNRRLFVRDELGRIIEVQDYNQKGKLINTDTTKYTPTGSTVIVNYGSEGDEGHHYMLHRYDTKDNLLEEGVYNPDGSVYSQRTNIYNEIGNLIEERWIEFADEFVYTSTKYEYDKYNNWIKQIDFVKDIPEYIIEREIECFD